VESRLEVHILNEFDDLNINIPDHENSNGIAFAFSGAGGRIAQHAALMEVLVKGLYPGATKIYPSYLSGASSGNLTISIEQI
jgi:hypothetical protein